MATAGIPFGKYLLVERIGRGGMAEVWRATISGPAGFARTLVVKRIRPQLVEDPQFVEMFCSEARLSARLSHANIVQVFEFGEVGGEYFLAMEHVRGRDLNAILVGYEEFGLPPPGLAAFVVREVARALGYAHGLADEHGDPLGLIHRDVSPSNVLVGFDGTVKLLDFGIAKALAQASANQTRTGVLKGKMGYLAPEQMEERRAVDHRADLFAAGVVLHEALTGRRLFVRTSTEETIELVRRAQVDPPSLRNPAVPAELDRICLRALQRDPDARYPSGAAMAAALDEVLHDLRWGPEQMAAAMDRMFGGASAAAIEGEPQATAVTAGAAGNAPEAAPPVSAVSGDGTRPLLLAATQVSGEGTSIMAPPRSVRWPLYGALALAAVGSAVAWRGVRRSGPPREEIAAAAPARPPERAAKSPTPARPAEVSATIRSLPSGAEVRVDGDEAAAGRTPVTLRLPASDGRRRVTLRAPGYRPLTLDVDGASDSQVAVALERLGPPPARPAQPARRKHADSGRAVLQGEVFDPFAATPAK